MRACVIDAQQKRVDLSYIQWVCCRKKFLSFGCSSTRMCRIDTHGHVGADAPLFSLYISAYRVLMGFFHADAKLYSLQALLPPLYYVLG